MSRPRPDRLPLDPETRAAARHVLRRPLWTSCMEFAVAADVLERGAVTAKQARLLLAVADRLAAAEAETTATPGRTAGPARTTP
jgi:hypothetical protein